ncbi:MAG TPA: hypothetical protein VEB70_05185 [Noviherbaspirillum sp.]|nr:hypothetical protein [Noviherbaspirillum sp.]
MLALPKEQNEPLETLMRQLREQAKTKEVAALKKGDASEVDFWRLVGMFSKHVSTAFKRENLKREKAQTTRELLDTMRPAPQPQARSISRYSNANALRLPATAESRCLAEVVDISFSPWIERGDHIHVDFTVAMLTVDSLYLVALDDGCLAIRGFHKSAAGWFVHENGNDTPHKVFVPGDRKPRGYEIVGRIIDVFKRSSVGN